MKVPRKVKEMPWPEPYKSGPQHFKVDLSWPVVDHERLMVATFVRNRDKQIWKDPGPDFRVVCSKKAQACAVLFRNGKSSARKKLDEVMKGFDTRPYYCYPEISPADERALARWLGKTPGDSRNHMMPEFETWVSEAVDAENLRDRDARGEIRDEDVSLCPQELPDGLVEYIHREILPKDNVLLYKKGNIRGTCYHCRQQVRATTKRFTQNDSVECPNCGQQVYTLLETSDRFRVDYVQNIASIQKGTDGKTVFIRLWHLKRDFTAAWTDIPEYLEEVARWAIRGRKAAKWQREGKENYYYSTTRYKLSSWTKVSNVSDVYDGTAEFFFPIDWEGTVQGTSLEYCDLEGYIADRRNRKLTALEIRFLLDWARYPAVEKLWKAGYTRLVCEKVAGLTKELRSTILWSRETIAEAIRFPKRLLKMYAPEQWLMHKLQKVWDAWRMVQTGDIKEREIAELVSCSVELGYFAAALKHTTVHKVCRYLTDRLSEEKSKKHPDTRWMTYNTPTTYRDYLKDCIILGWDLDDPAILLPRNLEAAHNRSLTQVRYKVSAEKEETFRRNRDRRLWMEWQRGDLQIRLPVNGGEIIAEGKALAHCVGGYVDRAAQGETTILFVRRVAAPDQPFYTLEWTKDRVVQCKSYKNKDYRVDPDVLDFVDAWVKEHANLKKHYRKEKTA